MQHEPRPTRRSVLGMFGALVLPGAAKAALKNPERETAIKEIPDMRVTDEVTRLNDFLFWFTASPAGKRFQEVEKEMDPERLKEFKGTIWEYLNRKVAEGYSGPGILADYDTLMREVAPAIKRLPELEQIEALELLDLLSKGAEEWLQIQNK